MKRELPRHCQRVAIGHYWRDDDSLEPGGQVHANHTTLSDSSLYDAKRTVESPWILSNLIGHSDYTGVGVERSNYRVWMQELDPESEHTCEVYGSHGYRDLAINIDTIPDDAYEALCALDDYCILDEEDLSMLESELEAENWNDMGRRDFRHTLAKETALYMAETGDDVTDMQYELEDWIDAAPDAAIDQLWWDAGCEQGEVYCIEAGGGVYYPNWERMVDLCASWLAADLNLLLEGAVRR